jgi:hypothetical protein
MGAKSRFSTAANCAAASFDAVEDLAGSNIKHQERLVGAN